MKTPRSRRAAKKRGRLSFQLLARIATSDLQPGDVLVIRAREAFPQDVLREASRMLGVPVLCLPADAKLDVVRAAVLALSGEAS